MKSGGWRSDDVSVGCKDAMGRDAIESLRTDGWAACSVTHCSTRDACVFGCDVMSWLVVLEYPILRYTCLDSSIVHVLAIGVASRMITESCGGVAVMGVQFTLRQSTTSWIFPLIL